MNYRVSMFGFLYMARPEAPGNVGQLSLQQAYQSRYLVNQLFVFEKSILGKTLVNANFFREADKVVYLTLPR